MVKVLSCICQPAILPQTSKHTHTQRSGEVWVRPCLFNILLKFDSSSRRLVYKALGKKENVRSLRLANLLPDQKITHTSSHDSWCICLMTAQASVSAPTETMCFNTEGSSHCWAITHIVLLSHTWWFQIQLIHETWPLFYAVCLTNRPHFNDKDYCYLWAMLANRKLIPKKEQLFCCTDCTVFWDKFEILRQINNLDLAYKQGWFYILEE